MKELGNIWSKSTIPIRRSVPEVGFIQFASDECIWKRFEGDSSFHFHYYYLFNLIFFFEVWFGSFVFCLLGTAWFTMEWEKIFKKTETWNKIKEIFFIKISFIIHNCWGGLRHDIITFSGAPCSVLWLIWRKKNTSYSFTVHCVLCGILLNCVVENDWILRKLIAFQ